MPKARKPINFDDEDSSRDLALILAEIYAAQDSVVLLVRGAIILDNLLDELLDRALHFEKSAHSHDKKYRLFFSGKCDLALASGVLSEQEWQVLRTFNRFRNRAAHGFDVHVHTDEVAELIKGLERYGWSPGAREGASEALPLIEMLRAAIVSLIGLLVERMAETHRSGKVAVLGKDLEKGRWERLQAFGGLVSMVTIVRERVSRAREKALRDTAERMKKDIETDKTLAGLTAEALGEELNRRFQETTPEVSETISAAEKEVQAIVDKLGFKQKVQLNFTPGPLRIAITHQGDPGQGLKPTDPGIESSS
jgi:hypothetical protein